MSVITTFDIIYGIEGDPLHAVKRGNVTHGPHLKSAWRARFNVGRISSSQKTKIIDSPTTIIVGGRLYPLVYRFAGIVLTTGRISLAVGRWKLRMDEAFCNTRHQYRWCHCISKSSHLPYRHQTTRPTGKSNRGSPQNSLSKEREQDPRNKTRKGRINRNIL